MVKRTCRLCEGTEFKPVIDFGNSPLVNSLLSKEELGEEEELFPLKVEQCQGCKLILVVDPVDSQKIYKDVDYLYFSSDMPGLKEYFQEYAKELQEKYIKLGDFVVEIGSNDGLMLGEIQNKYVNVLGVDPASNVVVRALKRGIPTISEFFGERIAKSIVREFRKADIIYGNNCIAHLHDLKDLMRGIKALLTRDGIFIVECNYWGGMVKNHNYSLIYHDHFSYFSASNWVDIANRFGMTVFDAYVTPAQGGSLRIFLSNNERPASEQLTELLNEEQKNKLSDYYRTVKEWGEDCIVRASFLGDLVNRFNTEGKTIAGYGAAAKGLSVLKLAYLGSDMIKYIVDDSPAKQGKYTPETHIPVITRQEAEKDLPDYFLITAPNYAKVIMEKEKNFSKNGGKFILVDGTIM